MKDWELDEEVSNAIYKSVIEAEDDEGKILSKAERKAVAKERADNIAKIAKSIIAEIATADTDTTLREWAGDPA